MARIQKKHLKSLAAVIAATVLVVIGSAMAFLSSSDETTNKFIGSRFDIVLTETKWNPQKAQNVIPGDELDKNPQIMNRERTTGYVFLRVTVPCDAQMVDNPNGTPMVNSPGTDVPMYKFMVAKGTNPETYDVNMEFSPKQEVNSHWQLIPTENVNYTHYDAVKKEYVYVYAYVKNGELAPLMKDEITEPLFDKLRLWNFNETYDPEKSHSVQVEAIGIQADITGYSPSDISGIWSVLEREVSG